MAPPLTLPSRLDLASVSSLAAALDERRGADLTLDAGQVDHMGALPVQLLLAAQMCWRDAGHRLTISPRSPAFDSTLATLGLNARFDPEEAT